MTNTTISILTESGNHTLTCPYEACTLEVDTQPPPLLETRDAKLWGKKCSRWLLCSSVVGVQVARHLILLAEQSLYRVGVLPARVFTSVRNAFAHIRLCESAALTRLCGRCTCVVQGGLPQCRHLGPHNSDPFPRTVTLRVIVSARQHSVQVGMKAHFTPRLACTCRPLTTALRSTCCCSVLRGR